jgi:hypothetical protein
MEYSKDFVLNSGGNRVATDGVDSYGRLWTTMDKLKACVLASQKFMVIVF